MSVAATASGGEGRRALSLFLLMRMAIGLALVCVVPFVEGIPSGLPIFDPKVLLVVGLGSFLVWTAMAALAPRLGGRPGFIWGQVILDALLTTALVQLTAGPRSALFVLYVANIASAGLLISPNAAIATAGLATGLYLSSSVWLNAAHHDRLWQISSFELAYELVLRSFALLLIGLLVRMLTQRVRQARVEQGVVLDEVPAGFLRVDRAGRVVACNPVARRLLGEVEGRRLREVLDPQEERWEQVVRAGDELHHLLCSRSRVETGGEVVLIEDVTRLKNMEAELVREERLAAVGRLTAALAHEIRNPLTSLSGAVQLLAEERPDPLHDIILREVRRINGLVEELLDQARPLSIQTILTDPSHIIAETISTFRLDPRFRDRIDVQMDAAGLSEVRIDPGRFRQVLWNLMLNAAQAIPERGRVIVSAITDGEDLLLRVADSGVGIPPEAQRRLFDPFFTTRVGGTGLGLATVHRIVVAHGGAIHVDSAPGQGTCFSLRFPGAQTAEGASLAG